MCRQPLRDNLLLVSHRFLLLCSLLVFATQISGTAIPLQKRKRAPSFVSRGHSHNDYVQAEPFASAIQHGMKSIEVDVFPRDGDLLVAHTVFGLDPAKRIGNMYIKPLLALIKREAIRNQLEGDAEDLLPMLQLRFRGGSRQTRLLGILPVPQPMPKLIGPETDSLTLLVDFKGDAEKSTVLLEKALKPLRPYLSKVTKNGEFRRGKVTVLISGNRPSDHVLIGRHTAKHGGNRYLFIDGRERDIGNDSDTKLVPMISVPWRSLHVARSVGRGEAHMRRLARRAHEQGKLLRIWGAPNDEYVWRKMVRSNVDLLCVDDHEKFARFARTYQK